MRSPHPCHPPRTTPCCCPPHPCPHTTHHPHPTCSSTTPCHCPPTSPCPRHPPHSPLYGLKFFLFIFSFSDPVFG